MKVLRMMFLLLKASQKHSTQMGEDYLVAKYVVFQCTEGHPCFHSFILHSNIRSKKLLSTDYVLVSKKAR